MAEEKKYDNVRKFMQELKELKGSKGLPEGISTEAQLWDEIFKKEAYLMPEQFFPLIREIHKKIYSEAVSVKPLATEYPVERVKTKEITSIRSDITVYVGGQDIYHFECEIGNDSAMVLRMFEYDAHVALEYCRFDPDAEFRKKRLNMVLPFPYSAVLYLQGNKSIPDKLSCKILFPDGSVYEYKVSAVCVQSYSLEEIQKKHLSILIPFLPLRFRKYLPPNRKTVQVKKEELTSFYRNIILILDKEVTDGYLGESSRKIILTLLRKAMIRVFYQDKALLEEVIEMTEPILELEFEKMERMAGQLAEELAKQMAEPMAKRMAEPMAKRIAEPMAKQLAEPMAKQMAEQMEIKYKKNIAELNLQKEKELAQKDKEITALKNMLWMLQNPQEEG